MTDNQPLVVISDNVPIDIYILHVEDQPALISGFGHTLGPRLVTEGQEFHISKLVMEEDESSDLWINLIFERGARRPLRVIYRFCTTEDEFIQIRESWKELPVCIVILDVFVGSPEAGTEFFKQIQNQWQDAGKIFYTAFPGTVTKRLGWPRGDDRLLEKPYDQSRVVDHMSRAVLPFMERLVDKI